MFGTMILALVPAAFAAEGASEGASASLLIGGALFAVLAVGVVMAQRPLLGLMAAAGVGALTTVYLTVQHFVAMHGGSSICNVSSVINCDAVNTSQYSELYGIPIALYGLGVYAAMGYLAFRVHAGRTQAALALLVVGAGLSVAFDVYLAWASVQVGALCVLCALSWTMNVALFIGSLGLVRKSELSFVDALGKAVADDAGPAVIMGLAVFIVGVLVVRNQEGARASGTVTASGEVQLPAGVVENVRGTITLDGTEPVRGDPAARYSIVEWADYECPHCGAVAPVLKKFLAKNPDVKLSFKNYPLSMDCNPYMQRPMHPYACGAAAAAECARIQGRFWELSEAMFQNQQYLSPEDIRFMAERAGLDVPSFEQCVQSAAAAEAVKADIEAGAATKLDGTPAIFVHGLYGDKWVKLNIGPGDAELLQTIFDTARAGKPLPTPVDPEPWPE